MRRVTAKRLKEVAKTMHNSGQEQFKDIPLSRIYNRLKKIWFIDAEFKQSVINHYRK